MDEQSNKAAPLAPSGAHVQFGRVPTAVIGSGVFASLRGSDAAVYLCICAYAGQDWTAKLSSSRLSWLVGLAEANVRRSLARLRDAGLLRRDRNHAPGGQERSASIVLLPLGSAPARYGGSAPARYGGSAPARYGGSAPARPIQNQGSESEIQNAAAAAIAPSSSSPRRALGPKLAALAAGGVSAAAAAKKSTQQTGKQARQAEGLPAKIEIPAGARPEQSQTPSDGGASADRATDDSGASADSPGLPDGAARMAVGMAGISEPAASELVALINAAGPGGITAFEREVNRCRATGKGTGVLIADARTKLKALAAKRVNSPAPRVAASTGPSQASRAAEESEAERRRANRLRDLALIQETLYADLLAARDKCLAKCSNDGLRRRWERVNLKDSDADPVFVAHVAGYLRSQAEKPAEATAR